MPGQRLGRTEGRNPVVILERLADGFELLEVADGGRRAVGVDVIHRHAEVRQDHFHTPDGAFAGRLHHVVAVRRGAVSGQFGVDLGAPGLGVFKFLQHHDAAAAGNDESVAVGVEGARRLFRGVVVAGTKRRHGVEQHRQAPMQFLAAAGENDVVLAPLDQLAAVADAVRAGRTRGADGIAKPLDLEGGGQGRRIGRRHGPRHHEGADLFWLAPARDVGGLDLVAGRGAAGAHDQRRALAGDLVLGQAGIGNGLFHGDVIVGRPVAHEATPAAVDGFVDVDGRLAVDMAAEAHVAVFLGKGDARAALAERVQDLVLVVANA